MIDSIVTTVMCVCVSANMWSQKRSRLTHTIPFTSRIAQNLPYNCDNQSIAFSQSHWPRDCCVCATEATICACALGAVQQCVAKMSHVDALMCAVRARDRCEFILGCRCTNSAPSIIDFLLFFFFESIYMLTGWLPLVWFCFSFSFFFLFVNFFSLKMVNGLRSHAIGEIYE